MSRFMSCYDECHYAECHYAECRYAVCRYVKFRRSYGSAAVELSTHYLKFEGLNPEN